MKKKYKVFITRPIPLAGITRLRRSTSVKLRKTDSVIPRKDLIAGVKTADALLPILTDTIDGQVMDAAPRLKVIGNFAVGYDNIDIEAATELGIVVTNTPGVVDSAVAEHTLALMLALSRRVVESDRFTRAKKYKAWMPMGFMGSSLEGKTLGIIGMGHIGSTLAAMAKRGLNMNIIYSDRRPNAKVERQLKAKKVSMGQLLKRADVVSVHVPLFPSTRHLIDTAELKKMKPTSILINTSRGPIVAEKPLIRALKTGRLGGAALDVYECEPLIDCDPSDRLELQKLENVVLTPHIASATTEARDAMSTLAADGIINTLRGRKPKNIVNPEVWNKRRR